MDNMYEPPGGDPTKESRLPEQFDEPRRRHLLTGRPGWWRPWRWPVSGIVAGISLANPSPAASTSAAPGRTGGGHQAAALNTALNSGFTPAPCADVIVGRRGTAGASAAGAAATAHRARRR
jgi:hypothetical protein